jgi:hypothetical protein
VFWFASVVNKSIFVFSNLISTENENNNKVIGKLFLMIKSGPHRTRQLGLPGTPWTDPQCPVGAVLHCLVSLLLDYVQVVVWLVGGEGGGGLLDGVGLPWLVLAVEG